MRRAPWGLFCACVSEKAQVSGAKRLMIFGRGHEIGGLNDARLFHHCNCRHYGGSRPWRVLLASPASGADATSEIREYINLSISLYLAPAPSRGFFLEISELSDVEAFGAVARQFSRQRPPRRGSPVNPPLDCRLLLMETTKIASVRWPEPLGAASLFVGK